MATNPLFQGSLPEPGKEPAAGLDPFVREKPKLISQTESAADLIRTKLNTLYSGDQNTTPEVAQAGTVTPQSKHQAFMYSLSTSGKSLADIQTAWHIYYQNLPDNQKHAVWQEFYNVNAQQKADSKLTADRAVASATAAAAAKAALPVDTDNSADDSTDDNSSDETTEDDTLTSEVINKISRGTAAARGKLEAHHQIKAVLFGLSFGAITLVIFLFGFFNEVVIAPFIQPGRSASATPIILGTDEVAPTKTPEVIIPKINVEIPLDFTVSSTDEGGIENALDGGVVHYPTTALPGQKGNTVYFGHSSNNIFNKGKYKFAFVLLHEMVPGDTFYLVYNQKVYAYQVFDKQVVDPSNISVLDEVPGQTATATLITCDPPGTSLKRLVVWGRQVNPNPDDNSAGDPPVVPTETPAGATPKNTTNTNSLPGNGATLWGRIVNWFKGD